MKTQPTDAPQYFQLGYLLAVTSLPERFYAKLHDLVGRDALYQNPAVSLKSYLVAHGLRKEMIHLEGPLLENLRECEVFSSDPDVMTQIGGRLTEETRELSNRINALDPFTRRRFVPEIQQGQSILECVSSAYDAIKNVESLPITDMRLITYKQAVFDLQDWLDDVSNKLDEVPSHSPQVA